MKKSISVLISMALAFALCAALSPTDPIAVASLSETAEIPKRSGSILKAESLLNDASGIVSFQFAVAAGMTGAFSLAEATGSFAVSFIGGILLGAAELPGGVARYVRILVVLVAFPQIKEMQREKRRAVRLVHDALFTGLHGSGLQGGEQRDAAEEDGAQSRQCRRFPALPLGAGVMRIHG